MKRKIRLSYAWDRPAWSALTTDYKCCRCPRTIKRGAQCLVFPTSAKRADAICAACCELDNSLLDEFPKPLSEAAK